MSARLGADIEVERLAIGHEIEDQVGRLQNCEFAIYSFAFESVSGRTFESGVRTPIEKKEKDGSSVRLVPDQLFNASEDFRLLS